MRAVVVGAAVCLVVLMAGCRYDHRVRVYQGNRLLSTLDMKPGVAGYVSSRGKPVLILPARGVVLDTMVFQQPGIVIESRRHE